MEATMYGRVAGPCVERLEPRQLFHAVTGMALINAETDQPIAEYASLQGDEVVLNLAALPTRKLNIEAAIDTVPGSVRFSYDGKARYRVDNDEAFSLGGDRRGNFKAWTPKVGTHTLIVTPYDRRKGKGEAGEPMSVTFTVIDQPASRVSLPSPTPQPDFTPQAFDHVYTVGNGGMFATIWEAIEVARPGDQVLLLPGVYREPIPLTRSGTPTKPITFAAQTPGTVTLDGTGMESVIASYGATYITIDGINVNHANNPGPLDPAAVIASTGWKLRNMVVENTDGVGVGVYGNNVELYNVSAQFNGRQGISGDGCSYVSVVNCTTRGNNTKHNDPDWDGGAGKWFQTDHVTIDNLTSYDNIGPGIWFDYHNTHVVVKNSRSFNNRGLSNEASGNGLRAEINTGSVVIQNNKFYGNTGPQLDIHSSKNVVIAGNTITGTHVALKDWDRGAEFAMSNISITDNHFIASGILTEGGTWNSASGAAKSLTIDRNTYQSGLTFTWNHAATHKSLAEVRSELKFEQDGVAV
jgi:hypothetical protein